MIIAIGFSAGGMQALKDMLPLIPAETDASYVLISHLLANHKSNLDAIISKCTSIPVVWASHMMRLQPNTIYLLPENTMMTVKNGFLMLRERRTDEVINNSIDIFFTSLAMEAKDKAIGVVLSGGGQDGLFGAKQITNNHGLVIVQDPKTAEFPYMPYSVIAGDHPSYILSPEDIVRKITEQIRLFPSEKF